MRLLPRSGYVVSGLVFRTLFCRSVSAVWPVGLLKGVG